MKVMKCDNPDCRVETDLNDVDTSMWWRVAAPNYYMTMGQQQVYEVCSTTCLRDLAQTLIVEDKTDGEA